MTMITPSYLGETIEYSSLHACRSTLEDPTPKSWIEVLKNATGVYLLTCPRTKEQYVGSAYGSEGFWQRWMDYAMTGHGGNVALKSREASDYQVSILELAGSNLLIEDIVAMETRWKRKLQSGEMGLNRN